MKKLNAFQIKILLLFLMVLDHIHYIPNVIDSETEILFHLISRGVAVMFAYLAVEGFIYTRNRLRYNLRIFIWAAIMFLGNTILNYMLANNQLIISNNIFLTLASAVLCLNLIFGYEGKNKVIRLLLILLGIILGAVAMMFTEGGLPVMPFTIITYALREHKKARNIVYLILSLFMMKLSYTNYASIKESLEMFFYNSDWAFPILLPFIYLYNGERGPNNNLSKYLFYVFYPLHLWVIYIIGALIIK